MIIESQDIKENTCYEADICIIGAGPAGISIAIEMQTSNKKIIILSGGAQHETASNQDLHKGFVDPKNSHEPLEENRRRAFGGGTVVWGGRCIPLDPIDFKVRDWIPYSGWPLNYDELEPYYHQASILCKTGPFEYDVPPYFKQANGAEIIVGLDNEDIISSKLERWSTPVNFAKDYYNILNESNNISVFLDTHLVSIVTESNGDTVSSIIAKADYKSITIRATTYILACGGIENPRLLLASKNNFHPHGIGNNNDVVGRYYMSHILGIYAELSPNNRKKIVYNFERDKEDVYCRRRWWITEKAQSENKIGNGIFFLHQATNQEGHRDALFSIVFVAKFILSVISEKSITKAKQKWGKSKPDFISHLNVITKEGWKQFPSVISIAFKRFSRRRLPFVLPSINSKSLGLYFQTEHMPNPKSRITIVENEVDALGIPRALVSVNFTEMDKKTIIEAHRIFVNRYKIQNLGFINYSDEGLISFIENRIRSFNSAAHHLGTTRMSNNPKLGVVDSNCKVHGMNNLYITGSSVFPTGGHVNPTLTIIALAIRLGNYLKNH